LYVPDNVETASTIAALVACNAHVNHGAADQLSCHIVGMPALVSAHLLTKRMLRQVSLTAATTVRRHSATSAGSSGSV